MRTKKLVFLGSKFVGYECFKYIVDLKADLGVEIAAVLLNTKASYSEEIRSLAKHHSIDVLTDPDDLVPLKEIELLISVQYHKILKRDHILSARRAVNLHMAPLPEYRGCNQFTFAIIDDSKIFGTTIHEISEGVDSGAIIAEQRFPIPENCFVSDLHEITVRESINLFKSKIKDLVDRNYTATPQSEYTDRSSSFHKRSEIDAVKEIDLSWPQEKIERYIRATAMPGFSGPYFKINGRKISLNLE